MAPQSPLRLPLAVVQEDSARATRRLDHEGNSNGAESGGQRFPPLLRLPLPILRPFLPYVHFVSYVPFVPEPPSCRRLTHLSLPLLFMVPTGLRRSTHPLPRRGRYHRRSPSSFSFVAFLRCVYGEGEACWTWRGRRVG